MTKLLLADVLPLEEKTLFAELYGNASCERRRIADSFRFMKDRMLSIGAAALLDMGLSIYGLREKNMSYGRSECGKPFFLNAPDIHFNISHSSSKVAVVFSDMEVGCDIEEVEIFVPAVAGMSLTKDELAAVNACEGQEERGNAFYRYWTLKESYMKATGMGMTLPPDSFSIRAENGYVAIMNGIPDTRFAFMTPHSFGGYECAVCFCPESGTPEVINACFDSVR